MQTKVPIEGKVFWGSKGIITLGESFDETKPFKIKYGTMSANFAFTSPQSKRETGKVAEEKAESKMESSQGSNESKSQEVSPKRNTGPYSSPKSKSGQGMALLAMFGTLLGITLSFL